MFIGFTIVVLAILGGALWRWRLVRRIEHAVSARLPVGSSGMIAGAEGFELAREGAPAVLLLHGGGDTPQTLRQLATYLHEAG